MHSGTYTYHLSYCVCRIWSAAGRMTRVQSVKAKASEEHTQQANSTASRR